MSFFSWLGRRAPRLRFARRRHPFPVAARNASRDRSRRRGSCHSARSLVRALPHQGGPSPRIVLVADRSTSLLGLASASPPRCGPFQSGRERSFQIRSNQALQPAKARWHPRVGRIATSSYAGPRIQPLKAPRAGPLRLSIIVSAIAPAPFHASFEFQVEEGGRPQRVFNSICRSASSTRGGRAAALFSQVRRSMSRRARAQRRAQGPVPFPVRAGPPRDASSPRRGASQTRPRSRSRGAEQSSVPISAAATALTSCCSRQRPLLRHRRAGYGSKAAVGRLPASAQSATARRRCRGLCG